MATFIFHPWIYIPGGISASFLFLVFATVFWLSFQDRWNFKKSISLAAIVTILLYFFPVVMIGVFCVWLCLSLLWYQFFHDEDDRLPRGVNPDYIDPRHTVTEYDTDGSIIAYFIKLAGSDGSLYPVTTNGMPSGVWEPGQLFHMSDRVPTKRNSNGIYAAKTWDSPVLDPYRKPGSVLEQVRLYPRVIEGQYGFRAHGVERIKTLIEY